MKKMKKQKRIDFAEAIEAARLRHGYNKAELARRSGLTYATIRSIYNGKENITLATLQKLATVLHLKIELKPHYIKPTKIKNDEKNQD